MSAISEDTSTYTKRLFKPQQIYETRITIKVNEY